MPGDLVHQYIIKCSGVYVRLWLYLQEITMHVFNGQSGTVLGNWCFIFRVMVGEKLVYKCPRGGIKDKYPQQHDSQYPV